MKYKIYFELYIDDKFAIQVSSNFYSRSTMYIKKKILSLKDSIFVNDNNNFQTFF
jgi:hypothetical protein